MIPPTHDEIALQAEQLWRKRGCPEGCDEATWLEAERRLVEDPPTAGVRQPDAFVDYVRSETAAESVVEHQISSSVSDQEAIQAALQKQDARAPQAPHHTGPKSKPAETGKPLWTKHHSS